jgi:hypothetical protein
MSPPVQSALVVHSCSLPVGQLAMHVDVTPPPPPPANMAQQMPVMQLLVPVQARALPIHAFFAVHELPMRVTQQTCVVESQVAIPHAIWLGPPSVPGGGMVTPEDPPPLPLAPEEAPDDVLPPEDVLPPDDVLPPEEAPSELSVPEPDELAAAPSWLTLPSELDEVPFDPPHAAAAPVTTTKDARRTFLKGDMASTFLETSFRPSAVQHSATAPNQGYRNR